MLLYMHMQGLKYILVQLLFFFFWRTQGNKKYVRPRKLFGYSKSFRNPYFQPLTCSDSKKH